MVCDPPRGRTGSGQRDLQLVGGDVMPRGPLRTSGGNAQRFNRIGKESWQQPTKSQENRSRRTLGIAYFMIQGKRPLNIQIL